MASYVGIDIGTNGCKLAVREGGVRLVASRMPENMISFGEVTSPETMTSFLKALRKQERIRAKNSVLVLSGAQAYFRHVTLPPMSADEVVLNLPYEFRDFISGDAGEYIYDYCVDNNYSGADADPASLQLFAAAVPKSLVESYSGVLGKAGFKLKSVIPAQLAYARIIERAIKSDPTLATRHIVLVDIGMSDVSVSLFRGSHYEASKTIDFGCNEIDAAIAEVKGIDSYTAGSYKSTNFDEVLDSPECQAVYDRLAIEISKVVNFYNFSSQDHEVEHMYFLGGGGQIAQLTGTVAGAISVPSSPVAQLFGETFAGEENLPTCALAVGGLFEGEAM